MRPTPNHPSRRNGFTLVELLVVITIIAILFALTAAAVSKAMVKMDESKTRNDISQLATDVQSFKTDFGATYMPSRIVLPPACDNTGESLQYISSLWPRISTIALGVTPQAFQFWGVPTQYTQGLALSGDQCLVFFLGGYRDGANNCFGFSTNPLNPLSPPATSGETRKGPYFPFPPTRLAAVSHSPSSSAATVGDQAFPSFIDTYGAVPYLYFSSRKAMNDYPAAASNSGTVVYPIQITVPSVPYSFTVFPYQISGPGPTTASAAIRVWANRDGYQIISAGRDTVFHDSVNQYAGGNLWPGYAGGATDQGGYDNMANFHPNLLGIGAN